MAELTPPARIGDDLRRIRLQVRAAQLKRVLAVLHGREQAADVDLTERRGLRHAIHDFHTELEYVRAELHRTHVDQPDRPTGP